MAHSAMANLLCPHLYRDLATSQQPGLSYCIGWVVHAQSQHNKTLERGELVLTSMMLGGQTQLNYTDSVYLL